MKILLEHRDYKYKTCLYAINIISIPCLITQWKAGFPFTWFSNLFMSIWIPVCSFFTLELSQLYYILIVLLMSFQIWPLDTLQVGSFISLTHANLLFFEYSLTFWYYKMFQYPLVFSLLWLVSQPLTQEFLVDFIGE